MKYLISSLYSFLFFALSTFGQNTRFSADFTGGIPITFASIPSDFSTFGGLGVRYSISKDLSLQCLLYGGSFNGSQVPRENFQSPDDVMNYKSYSNSFLYYSINGQLNLERFLGLRPFFKRTNPYLVAGVGRVQSDVMAYMNIDNNRNYTFSFFSSYAGLSVRHYINPQLDLVLTAYYNFTQTWFLDGIPTDKTNDAFLLSAVGINYKFSAKSQKQHIEWNNVILKNRIYIPDIEKRNGQPVDEDGNYVIYSKDSISRLIAVNQAIQQQNQAQRSEIEFLRKQIDSINRDMGAVKDQMKSVTSDVELLKQQNQMILDRLNKMPIPAEQQTQPKDKPVKKDSGTQKPDAAQVDKPVIIAPESSSDKSISSNTNSNRQNIPAKPSDNKSNQKATSSVEKQNDNIGTKNQSKEQESNATRKDVASSASSNLNSINEITEPIEIFNVVVGAYTSSKFALIYRNQLRSKGYDAAVFRSNINSRILRVCVISTSNKQDALRVMRKARVEIDPKAWIHVYKK
ncbi:MAG: hypothetical protein ACK5FU_09175 [Bacteroidota bacterium]